MRSYRLAFEVFIASAVLAATAIAAEQDTGTQPQIRSPESVSADPAGPAGSQLEEVPAITQERRVPMVKVIAIAVLSATLACCVAEARSRLGRNSRTIRGRRMITMVSRDEAILSDEADELLTEGEATQDIYAEVLRLLDDEPRGKLLDAPAGKGALSGALYEAGYDVTAGDIDPSKFRHAEIPVKQIDLNGALPWPDREFDYVVCVEGIEHLDSPYRPCAEFHRVLKDDGVLIITTPNIANMRSRLKFLFTGTFFYFDPTTFSTTGHLNPIPWFELEYVVKRSGFEVESMSTGSMELSWRVFGKMARTVAGTFGLAHDSTRLKSLDVIPGGLVLVVKARKPAC